MVKKWLGVLLVMALGLPIFLSAGQSAQADSNEVQVYFEGKRLAFEDADPILVGGRTMVPFRKIFETLGFKVEWIGGNVRKAVGKKDNLSIELTIDSNKAKVNGKTVELDVPAQVLKGSTLVPLRFVSENSGFHVIFAKQDGTSIVGIGATEQSANPGIVVTPPAQPAPSPAPSSGKAEPYVVKGRVVNSQGQPLPWTEVYADNTFLYDSNVLGVTDEKGMYRIELPKISTAYRMSAKHETQYQGKTYAFNLRPEPDLPFPANTGAVRDFVLDIAIGEVEVHSWDSFYPYDEEGAPWVEMHEVELTLKPVGKRVDGSAGQTITGFPIYRDGARLENIPVGTYEISAIWKPEGYQAVPLLVSLKNPEKYGERITADFQSPFTGYHLIQLEVKFP